MPSSQEQSKQYLQQTQEAKHADLKFEKIYDLRPATAAAREGAVLSVRQLHAVAVTLEAALNLRGQLGMSHDPESSHHSNGEQDSADSGPLDQRAILTADFGLIKNYQKLSWVNEAKAFSQQVHEGIWAWQT